MTTTKKEIGVLILAAGNSTRMGSPKFLLKFDEKRCFLQKIIEDYTAFGCSEIKIILNKKGVELLDNNNLQAVDKKSIIINSQASSERFYSTRLGLTTFNKATWIFIHHVDNPFVELNVLDTLLNHKQEANYIVPSYKGKGGHPILVGEKIINEIRNIRENNLHFKKFLGKYSCKNVSVNSKSILININTSDEYNDLFANK